MKLLSAVLCLVVFIEHQFFVESKLSDSTRDNNYQRRPFPIRPSARRFPLTDGDDPGKPLFLTPYIEAGKIKKAQKLSKVSPAIGDIPSYSGYLTVNKECDSNLFFWYFPAAENSKTAPLVLWLQGGPGCSSLYGLFEELGPFNSFEEGLQMRNYSWNKKNNLLFIDQPVGTGYSFTSKGCYATNQTMVGNDLYNALIQFLTMFPKLQKNKFYVTGESYAGHYIPAIGHTIHINNPAAEIKINLCGMMIGDGWTDPREQIDYGSYLYQLGFIDYTAKEKMQDYQGQFVTQVDQQDWEAASKTLDSISLMFDETGVNAYNYLPQPKDLSNWDRFIQTPSTRKAIHVGSQPFVDGSQEVYDNLLEDVPKSVKPWVEELLDHHYLMVFYGGQLDVICAYPMVIKFLRSLNWSGQEEYLNAPRLHWVEDDIIAGYIKGTNNLVEVLVRDAGHMVPADQPFWAFQLVNAVTTGNFSSLTTNNKNIESNDNPSSN